MTTRTRPLAGQMLGLSISESEDSTDYGFLPWQINQATVQVVAALLGQGAGVVFGHDWRDDGVMETVHGYALQVAAAGQEPLLANYVPWPDKPHLPEAETARLAATLQIIRADLPATLKNHESQALAQGSCDALYQYLRARGLTELRHRLNERSTARLCLGGKCASYQGRYPGIVEEALFAIRSGKPLYISAILGGASRQIVEALEGKPIPKGFCANPAPITLYQHYANALESTLAGQPDLQIDGATAWQEFQQAGFDRLAQSNGLTLEENRELAHTGVMERVVQLVLKGLGTKQARA